MGAETTTALLSEEREQRRIEVMLLRSDIARIERRERALLDENLSLRLECATLRLQLGKQVLSTPTPFPSTQTPLLATQAGVLSMSDPGKVLLGGYAPTLPAADARKVRRGSA